MIQGNTADFLVHRGKRVPGDSYTLQVGDLCYLVIGQIVNRNLSVDGVHTFTNSIEISDGAVSRAAQHAETEESIGPPTALLINSPVQARSLAEAVRRDWSGVTANDHEKRLEDDLVNFNSVYSPAALKRLLYYYPAEGRRVFLRYLSLPLFRNVMIVSDIERDLYEQSEPSQWHKTLKAAQTANGDDVGDRLAQDLSRVSEIPPRPGSKSHARQILQTLFSGFDPDQPTEPKHADLIEQNHLIESVRGFKDLNLDGAIQDCFRGAIQWKARPNAYEIKEFSAYCVDQLALTCISRMAGRGFDNEYLLYFRRRLRESGGYYDERGFFTQMSAWTHSIQSRKGPQPLLAADLKS